MATMAVYTRGARHLMRNRQEVRGEPATKEAVDGLVIKVLHRLRETNTRCQTKARSVSARVRWGEGVRRNQFGGMRGHDRRAAFRVAGKDESSRGGSIDDGGGGGADREHNGVANMGAGEDLACWERAAVDEEDVIGSQLNRAAGVLDVEHFRELGHLGVLLDNHASHLMRRAQHEVSRDKAVHLHALGDERGSRGGSQTEARIVHGGGVGVRREDSAGGGGGAREARRVTAAAARRRAAAGR